MILSRAYVIHLARHSHAPYLPRQSVRPDHQADIRIVLTSDPKSFLKRFSSTPCCISRSWNRERKAFHLRFQRGFRSAPNQLLYKFEYKQQVLNAESIIFTQRRREGDVESRIKKKTIFTLLTLASFFLSTAYSWFYFLLQMSINKRIAFHHLYHPQPAQKTKPFPCKFLWFWAGGVRLVSTCPQQSFSAAA